MVSISDCKLPGRVNGAKFSQFVCLSDMSRSSGFSAFREKSHCVRPGYFVVQGCIYKCSLCFVHVFKLCETWSSQVLQMPTNYPYTYFFFACIPRELVTSPVMQTVGIHGRSSVLPYLECLTTSSPLPFCPICSFAPLAQECRFILSAVSRR